MKSTVGLAVAVLAFGAGAVQAQQFERGVAVVSEDAANQIPVFSYRAGPESDLALRPTTLTPAAGGTAEVEFQDGRARVDARVEKLAAPASLGPYTLYVLWAITKEGSSTNVGFFDLKGGSARLRTSVPLSEFALIVTAEPHFAVTVPSRAVVLQNFAKKVEGRVESIGALKERADYASLPKMSPGKNDPPEMVQLRYAVAIAKAVQAPQYAPEQYGNAEEILRQAEADLVSKKRSDRTGVPQNARRGIQSAEEARQHALVARADAEQKSREAAQRAQAEADAQRREAAVAEEARRAAVAADAEARRREAETARLAAAQGAARERAELNRRLNAVLPTQDTERGLVAQIAGVNFATGKATLNSSARETLARFGGIVAAYPEIRFVIEGHTDSVGSEATNMALSYQRAITVRDFLIQQGVAASSIDVKGLGPSMPVADNATAEGRAANRRVEVVMSGGPIGAARSTL